MGDDSDRIDDRRREREVHRRVERMSDVGVVNADTVSRVERDVGAPWCGMVILLLGIVRSNLAGSD